MCEIENILESNLIATRKKTKTSTKDLVDPEKTYKKKNIFPPKFCFSFWSSLTYLISKSNQLIKMLAYARLFSWYLCLIRYDWVSSQIKKLSSCLPVAAESLKVPGTNTTTRIRYFRSNHREILQTDPPVLSFSPKFWWLRASPSKSHQGTDADWIINPILIPLHFLLLFFPPFLFF